MKFPTFILALLMVSTSLPAAVGATITMRCVGTSKAVTVTAHDMATMPCCRHIHFAQSTSSAFTVSTRTCIFTSSGGHVRYAPTMTGHSRFVVDATPLVSPRPPTFEVVAESAPVAFFSKTDPVPITDRTFAHGLRAPPIS